jgi:hypothetical protein
MRSPEVFYLHIDGEQRGPYTIPQIDHLLNTGLITEDALFWVEGLDQWAPVTTLVVKREARRPWRKILAILVLLAALGLLVAFFGPVLLDGWREASQPEYTAKAAYWRARDVVRSHGLSAGTVVKFRSFDPGAVRLRQPFTADVELRGEVLDAAGQPQQTSWRIEMKFDEQRAEWSGKLLDHTAPPVSPSP